MRSIFRRTAARRFMVLIGVQAATGWSASAQPVPPGIRDAPVAPGMRDAPAAQTEPSPPAPPPVNLRVAVDADASALLKAMSDRLAAARTMTFRAIVTYESPARTGFPLAYTVRSDVVLERPNKLRVTAPADGPPSDFLYDGKTMTAYSPDTRLAAVADAPPTIDAALRTAFQSAAIYFPFTDIIVDDPYQSIADGLRLAFVMGQSRVVGDTTTDIVVAANDGLQAQIWIGHEDKLPRMVQVFFLQDPAKLRQTITFGNWQLNQPLPTNAFTLEGLDQAARIPFARPDIDPKDIDPKDRR